MQLYRAGLMHRWTRSLFFMAALCLADSAAPASALDGELSSGPDIMLRTKEDFQTSRFDALEARGEEFRRDQSRTPSGSWKLAFVYDALKSSAYLMDAPYNEATLQLVDDRLDAWLKAYPLSRQAHISKVQLLINRAWMARGNGYASTVKPEAWAIYHGYLERAARAHNHIRAFAAEDPEWHVLRLELARDVGAPKERFEAIEDEALAMAPTYQAIHKSMLASKQPHWGGSWAAYDDGVDKIVSRTASTEGQSFYARNYGDLAMGRLRARLFQRSLAKWPRMKKGFEDLTSRYPTDWNWNLYGAFACLAGDRPALRDILARLGERVEVDAWKEIVDQKSCAKSMEAERTAAEDAAHYAKAQPVPTEILERNEIANAASLDFAAGRFAQLDARRDALIQGAETTSSGNWKLTYFHEGLNRLGFALPHQRGWREPDISALEIRVAEWLAADPTSKTALILRAELTLRKARWMLREPQSGAERGGAGFGVLAKARAELAEARRRMPDDPRVWAATVELALDDRGTDEEFFTVAEQALAAAPDYPDVKAAILKRDLLSGTFTKAGLDKSVEFIVMMSPPDRKQRAYFASYVWLNENMYIKNLFEHTFADWTRMKRGLDELISAHPTDWNLNSYANLACAAKDKSATAALLEKVGDRIVERQWSNWRAPAACKAWLSHTDRSESR